MFDNTSSNKALPESPEMAPQSAGSYCHPFPHQSVERKLSPDRRDLQSLRLRSDIVLRCSAMPLSVQYTKQPFMPLDISTL